MAHEAKFSVILPAANFSKSRIEEFEEQAHHYNLPVSLPLKVDSNDNVVVQSGLSLRDAQVLRRKVAECGYTADVISDAAPMMQDEIQQEGNTLVLGEHLVNTLETAGDMASDAWDNLEMPDLDLGLTDGAEIDDWHDVSVSDRTQSVNIFELLEAAQSAQSSPEDSFVPNTANDSFSPKLKAALPASLKGLSASKDGGDKPSDSQSSNVSAADASKPVVSPTDGENKSQKSLPHVEPTKSSPKAEVSSNAANPAQERQKPVAEDKNKRAPENAINESETKSISKTEVEQFIKAAKQSETKEEPPINTNGGATVSISAEQLLETVRKSETNLPPAQAPGSTDEFPISVVCMNIPDSESQHAPASASQPKDSVSKPSSGSKVFIIVMLALVVLALLLILAAYFFDIPSIVEMLTKPLF